MAYITTNDVHVIYEDYANASDRKCKEVNFDLLQNIEVVIRKDNVDGNNGVTMVMQDKITELQELSGFLDKNKLLILIKALKEIHNQL